MPKRQRSKRTDSKDVQGKGSWVTYKAPTVSVFRDFRKEIGVLNERLEQLSKADEKDMDAFNAVAREQEAVNVKFMAEYITDWNWVADEDGEIEMDKPLGNPEIFYTLTQPEMVFLANLFNPDTKKKTR